MFPFSGPEQHSNSCKPNTFDFSDTRSKMEGRDVHEQRTLSAGGNAKTDGPQKHVIMKMSDQKSANKCTAVEEQMKGDDINDLADAFIKNFRNQLRIQREESFKRFQDMLARGT